MLYRNTPNLLIIGVLLLAVTLFVCQFGSGGISTSPPQPTSSLKPTSPPQPTSIPQPTSPPVIGLRTKTSACVSNGGLPDPACTPGDIFPGATKEQVCTPGYSKQVRNVPESVKIEAYSEYGITQHQPGEFEVDHLISLELGGSNDIANLWPEPAEPRPGFHEKDMVENYLHEQICSGAISLQQAQVEIAGNWLSIYQAIPK